MAINTLLQANITDKIIGSFFAVYNELGFGFLESVYANAMLVELSKRKALVKREVHFGPRPRYRRFVYSNPNKQFNKIDPR